MSDLPTPPSAPNSERPNPGFGYTSDNMTAAEVTTYRAEREREDRIEELEYAVIEAAEAWRKPVSTIADSYSEETKTLIHAVDALIREREGK